MGYDESCTCKQCRHLHFDNAGFDLDENGNPKKWLVENSWGASHGWQGHLIMTDEWFEEYMFRVVVDKKYISNDILKYLDQKPIVLPPWDPMFSEDID